MSATPRNASQLPIPKTAAERLRWAREVRGGYGSATKAATAHGWNPSTYRTHENGHRNFGVEHAKSYGRAYGLPWQWLLEGPAKDLNEEQAILSSLTNIVIRGEVAAGLWLDADVNLSETSYKPCPIAPSPDYPSDVQFALVVRGTSIDKLVAEGSVLHCVVASEYDHALKDDDVVIVERTRKQQGQRELTAKIYRREIGRAVLLPHSTDPRWKPIHLKDMDPAWKPPKPEDEEVRIDAVVIGFYTAMQFRKH